MANTKCLHDVVAPGVLHHVMGRGIERKKLFIDKRDRQDFNTRLAALTFEKLCTFCTSTFGEKGMHNSLEAINVLIMLQPIP